VARRGSNRRMVRRFVGLMILAVGGVMVWSWGMGKPSSTEDSNLFTLKSERMAITADSPLGLVDNPAAANTTPDQEPLNEASASSKEALIKLSAPTRTQPAVKREMSPPVVTGGKVDLLKGFAAREQKNLVTARTLLNRALAGGLDPEEIQRVRRELTSIANETLFSRAIYKDDPLITDHVIQSGDTLGKIAKAYKISEDLLAEINKIKNKNFIRVGRRIKTLNGPFHATIDKSDHVMHIYLQDVYVRSYRVALGMHGSTPTGKWKVCNHQVNPGWTDPRDGKRWHPEDPDNPIGEFWIGLEGLEGDATGQFGYGIHGTIEPETIGQDVSLGCVRLAADDIAAVYKMLLPGHSLVTIKE